MSKSDRQSPFPYGSGKKYKQSCAQLAPINVGPGELLISTLLQVPRTRRDQCRPDRAVASYRQAVSLKPNLASSYNNKGNALRNQGKLEEAIECYRRALSLKPGFAEAHNNLGTTLHDQGKLEEAIESYRRALSLESDYANAHNNLGSALRERGNLNDAVASYRKALLREPGFAEAHNNLGTTLRDQGKLEEAIESYRRALSLKPDYSEAHNNVGNVLREQGKLKEAIESYRKALSLRPEFAEAFNNLGTALLDQGNLTEAAESYRKAIFLKPEFAEALENLGAALLEQGNLEGAIESYRKAISFRPNFFISWNNLGNALRDQGKLDEALTSYRQALSIKPDFAEAHNNLGHVLRDQCKFDEALASYSTALLCRPNYAHAQSGLLFCINYHPDKNGEEIFAAYREYEQRFGRPHRGQWYSHLNKRQSGRQKLKVGYASPDFRKHAVSFFLEPLLACHDRAMVEVFAYAEVKREDATSARFKSYVDHWIPTLGMSDEALAQRIRDDRIDILVDVAGHTSGNRLGVFARKPAPVLVSWLGCGYTTGLNAIDYFLTDQASTPAGSEGLFSERPWRLGTPQWVYRAAEGIEEVSVLPALERGFITFGTLSRAVRINDRVVGVWSEILKGVARSHLVVDSWNFKDPAMQDALAQRFAVHGIERDRLEIGYHSPPWGVLRGLDIGLDCFPHNSGTTLFDTLYMGVPFVTLVGRPSVGRLGSSVLHGLGRPEWIAWTEREYIDKALALAANLPELATLRGELRQQMQASALMDEPAFARAVECAYREMWRQWCDGVATGANFG